MNKMTGIILMLSGTILFLVGIYFYNTPINPKNSPSVVPEIVIKDSVQPKSETESIDQNKKKGNDFEDFITQKFNKKYFKLKEWAGDKYVNGIYAETTLNPDLLYEFSLKGETSMFAVECKWRKNLYKNSIEFATQDQLERYRKYEEKRSLTVFLAIGLGGLATDPDHLYIVPLSQIKSNSLSKEFLGKFEKDKTANFFFDPQSKELR